MTMTEEQRRKINQFIAEKCGWHRCYKGCEGRTWRRPDDSGCQESIPDYTRSLDACHEAFRKMGLVDQISFHHHLRNVVRAVCADNLGEESVIMVSVNATAEQRALALFQTLGGVL